MKRSSFILRVLKVLFVVLFLLIFVWGVECRKSNRKHAKQQQQPKNLKKNNHSRNHLEKLNVQKLLRKTAASNQFDEKLFRSILDNILVPRSINTVGHEQVRQYIKHTLRDLNSRWRIEEDIFRARTPAGQVKFRNIIATYVPDFGCMKQHKMKRTVLACHYDSLYPTLVKGKSSRSLNDSANNTNRFTGATDAAVSCALLIYLAQSLNDHLDKIWRDGVGGTHHHGRRRKPSTTLQLVFFDGEETLLKNAKIIKKKNKKRNSSTSSSKSGSLYGSRHLAHKWDTNSQKIRERNHHHSAQLQSNSTIASNNFNTIINNGKKSSNHHHPHRQIIICDGIDSKMAKLRSIQNDLNITTNKRLNRRHRKKLQNNNLKEISLLKSEDYNTIDGIKLFILLDLIGASGNRFYNTNLNTSLYFQQLAKIEKKLLEVNEFNGKPLFQQNPGFVVSLVRDDHLPFIVRNVPVLHLIPHPFPKIWHSIDDNVNNLNFQTIGRFATIMQLFLVNLFHQK